MFNFQFELLTVLQDLSVLYFLVFCMQANVLLKIHAYEFYSVMSLVLDLLFALSSISAFDHGFDNATPVCVKGPNAFASRQYSQPI